MFYQILKTAIKKCKAAPSESYYFIQVSEEVSMLIFLFIY